MNCNRVIAVLFVLIFAVSVQAQSGRRQVKPPPPAPVPSPTPEPSPIAKKKEDAELVYLVASERNSINIPLYYYDVARRACADRLRSRSTADVDTADRDMTRGEAIQKAKSAQKTYVVLLSLTFDTMSNTSDDIQLDFLLLEPVTAKVVLTGRSYLNANRKGPLIVNPTGRTSALYREQLLRAAGEDAADRILKKMKIASVPK